MKQSVVYLAIGSLIISSCVSHNVGYGPNSGSGRTVRQSSKETKNNYSKIKKQLKTGAKKDESIKSLQRLRQEQDGTDLEQDINNTLAQEEYQNGQYSQAAMDYLRSAKAATSSDRALQSCEASFRSFERANESEKALKALELCLKDFNLSKPHAVQLRMTKISFQERNGQTLGAMKDYVDLVSLSEEPQASLIRTKALVAIDGQLTMGDLKKIAEDADYGFLRAYAHYKLGKKALESREESEARYHFSSVSTLLPSSDIAESSIQMLGKMDQLNRVNPTTIGAILPLSGKHAAVGNRILRGLQMGLGIDGVTPSPFKLAVIDSEANADVARRAVDKLVQEDNVIAIVGSLLSKTASSVANEAQMLGVPSIALSQKAGITDSGDLVFRNALTSEAQVRHLVNFAMKELGIHNFAIVYPNDKFGVEYANLFWDEVLARGGEIRAVQTYESDETDFREIVQRLVGTYFIEDRIEEHRYVVSQWTKAQQGKSNARTHMPEDLLPSIVDFEAIFVADNLKALGQIAPMLAFNNIRNVKVLGLNVWNSQAIVKRIQNILNQVIFVDNVQPEMVDPEKNKFVKTYKNWFGEMPGSFEIQGFDTGYLLQQALSDGIYSREQLKMKLSGSPGFSGALGPMSISADREIVRPLVNLTVDGDQIKPLDQIINE